MINYRMKSLLIVFLSLLITPSLFTYDNPHFYRATNLFFEARLERPWLSTFDIAVGTGSTKCALNACGDRVPLFDIYGKSNIQELGAGVPCKDPSNPLDLLLIQLALTPGRDCFATFSIGAEFDITEAYLSWIQNYSHGLFVQFLLPYRKLEVNNICLCDLSPTDTPCPNINTPIWQEFKDNFCEILNRYCLRAEPFKEKGVGDLAILLGWTHSYDQSEILDFVDTSWRIGVLVPTGKKQDQDNPFSIPLGYDGHWGIPFAFDFAFGSYDWLTLAVYFNAIVFADKTRIKRIKTSFNQSGIIKLAKAEVCEEKGSIWTIGTYAKADHFLRGLSVLVGYTFANQNSDSLSFPCPDRCFCSTIANSDETLRGWKMHTVHFWAELDFTLKDAGWGPRFAFFYNLVVGGKRIFKTNMVGGIFGIDIGWYC